VGESADPGQGGRGRAVAPIVSGAAALGGGSGGRRLGEGVVEAVGLVAGAVEAATPWVCGERRGILYRDRNPSVKWLFDEQRELGTEERRC
jgi:hypothetical protein